jgi:hypothetical protein
VIRYYHDTVLWVLKEPAAIYHFRFHALFAFAGENQDNQSEFEQHLFSLLAESGVCSVNVLPENIPAFINEIALLFLNTQLCKQPQLPQQMVGLLLMQMFQFLRMLF